jgi:hypothetical protein
VAMRMTRAARAVRPSLLLEGADDRAMSLRSSGV